ncbi:MAG: glycosyltransferase family 2 protein [Thermoguttaceae bacterium]
MNQQQTIDLEVLLPVHNEAETIEKTIREIFAELSRKVRMRFIICEDGSKDATKEVLTRLSAEIPMKLILSDARKGYSRAVRDGMQAQEAPYLLCLDSDGQCDPKDFWGFWERRSDSDAVIGWRIHRADTLLRRVLSRTFHIFYQLLYRVPVHDPSCSYVLARKEVISMLVGEVGAMQQGFWWEFVARLHRHGFSIDELPVNHRLRSGGTTQVYKFRKMPGIFCRHFLALFKIWFQTRSLAHERELASNVVSLPRLADAGNRRGDLHSQERKSA